MTTFPPIADYAFLSDCEVSALVAPDGCIEWMCLPRPDSASLFGALLDRSAGFFQFAPSTVEVAHQRRYLPGTSILETSWHTPTGWLTVTDLLVMGPSAKGQRPERYRRVPGDWSATGTLLRIATCDSGRVEVMINCLPLFDYGRVQGEWSYPGDGYDRIQVSGGDLTLELVSSLRLGVGGARGYGHTMLDEGDSAFVALSWGGRAPTSVDEAFEQLRETARFWRDWLSVAQIPDHRWRPYIERSTIALKGLSYAPTGAIMAAGTTSLPESPGGERNWDYRYTWIRDSAFMLRALHDLGFDWEAFEYFAFILDAVQGDGGRADVKPGDFGLQIMYGIGGERDLTEHTLDHLSGYLHSRPVRIGNGAYDQHQHDVWGMLLDSVATHIRNGGQMAPGIWAGISFLVDTAIERAPEPDQGIWEMRGEPKHFVASKVMCWVAADRGVQLAREREDDDAVARWQAAADKIHAEVLKNGVGAHGVFKQHYDTDDLDASLLLIPIMGFLPPDDKRVHATVLAIADNLTKDDLVLRYRVETTDDGLSGEEGTFTICSFWLVSALAMIGEVERARALFEKLLSFAGPLLLYAEEIDTSTGMHLGNFPQAFTHLSLIDAAKRLIAAEGAQALTT
ncbi:MAG TPA: glycoside hydrolase family 15 protein [Acidimicrobiia bacterium]|nr:glycoside hydrolase family 15 protein [Acidimicrobiia bacterium]